MPNYATKSDLKRVIDIDASVFAKKADLGVDKLKTVSVDLSKLSKVVKNNVIKKTVYDELLKNDYGVQTNDTSQLKDLV